jgi:hypothetical protein
LSKRRADRKTASVDNDAEQRHLVRAAAAGLLFLAGHYSISFYSG